MSKTPQTKTATSAGNPTGEPMNRKWGVVAMFISATGMGLVPLFSRWGTRTEFFEADSALNAGDSVGALMAVGRMGMGVLFFVVLLFATKKVQVFKELKLSPAIAMGGLMIGMSLACYVTATLLTTIANAILFIYIGPVICVVLARIFRKEPMSWLSWVCLFVVFVGMLFGNEIISFDPTTFKFSAQLDFQASTDDLRLKGLGDLFGIASGFFYGSSMFFNGYRKDADTTARGVWNFIFAVIGAGSITIVLHFMGTIEGYENWSLNLHLTTFNLIGAVLLWIICGPIALGFLLVAGKNLPAADYGTIAYWEVPVALFVGIVIFKDPFTFNTFIALVLIIGGGAVPSIKTMLADKKKAKQELANEQQVQSDLTKDEPDKAVTS
ncbi:MAG: DMT family transporter [Actinomycetaceae bacterium]|nr:DMT family transporter [Actinomycetaceae bacterium]